jgi:prepilin-type N-terminal cleavage/methylation domain-containing protein
MFLALDVKTSSAKNGFTLLELLAVIIITSVVLTLAYPRITQSNTALLQAHNSSLWMLRKSRQTALSLSHHDQYVLVEIDKNTLRSYLINTVVNSKNELATLLLPNSIIILKGRGQVSFNFLGEASVTDNAEIEITLANLQQPKKDTETIILTAGGYAY